MQLIMDSTGKVIREIANISKEKGFNRTAWDLAIEGATQRRQLTPEQLEQIGGFGFRPRGPEVLPGNYTVKLIVGDKSQEKKVQIGIDPTVKVSAAELQEQYDLSMKLQEMMSKVNVTLRLAFRRCSVASSSSCISLLRRLRFRCCS